MGRAKLAELEGDKSSRTKAELVALQAKLQTVEDERDAEAKQRYELSKLVRRSDKKIKDANLQAEEERRVGDQYKEQVEKLNSRLRAANARPMKRRKKQLGSQDSNGNYSVTSMKPMSR